MRQACFQKQFLPESQPGSCPKGLLRDREKANQRDRTGWEGMRVHAHTRMSVHSDAPQKAWGGGGGHRGRRRCGGGRGAEGVGGGCQSRRHWGGSSEQEKAWGWSSGSWMWVSTLPAPPALLTSLSPSRNLSPCSACCSPTATFGLLSHGTQARCGSLFSAPCENFGAPCPVPQALARATAHRGH